MFCRHQKSCEWHNRFARYRKYHALHHHSDENRNIASLLDKCGNIGRKKLRDSHLLGDRRIKILTRLFIFEERNNFFDNIFFGLIGFWLSHLILVWYLGNVFFKHPTGGIKNPKEFVIIVLIVGIIGVGLLFLPSSGGCNDCWWRDIPLGIGNWHIFFCTRLRNQPSDDDGGSQ